MKSLALLSEKAASLLIDEGEIVHDFILYGNKYQLAIIEKNLPEFNPEDEQFDELVLLRKIAFSLNFRDKGMLLYMQELINKDQGVPVQVGIGSEFIAEVLQVGKKVKSLKVGDKVIPNAHYPSIDSKKVYGGIPSNHASSALDVLHELQLISVPDTMNEEVGAIFSIGCQTAFGMIRRLQLDGSGNVLITSGTSSTSLFILAALKGKVNHITVLTTQVSSVAKLKELGADDVVLITDRNKINEEGQLLNIYNQVGGFDVVVDPFSDIYLPQLVSLINVNGKYVTCGIYYQSFQNANNANNDLLMSQFLLSLIGKNITMIFNCLGNTEDLKLAVEQHINGDLPLQVDSVFSDGQVVDFLTKSFSESEKFGKVVYKY